MFIFVTGCACACMCLCMMRAWVWVCVRLCVCVRACGWVGTCVSVSVVSVSVSPTGRAFGSTPGLQHLIIVGHHHKRSHQLRVEGAKILCNSLIQTDELSSLRSVVCARVHLFMCLQVSAPQGLLVPSCFSAYLPPTLHFYRWMCPSLSRTRTRARAMHLVSPPLS